MNLLTILVKKTLYIIFSQIFAAWQNLSSLSYFCKKIFGLSGVQIFTHKSITSRKVAIFASFHSKPNGLLEAQINELSAAGFECVFVSNAKVSSDLSNWLQRTPKSRHRRVAKRGSFWKGTRSLRGGEEPNT